MIYSIPDNEILEPLRGFINKIYCFCKLGEYGTSIHNYIEPNGIKQLDLIDQRHGSQQLLIIWFPFLVD